MSSDRWHQIENLFDEALEQPAGGRKAWLKLQCSDDQSLFDEVWGMVKSVDETGFLDAGLDNGLGDVAISAFEGLNQSKISDTIGAWQIQEKIGSGGMGTVYKATRADASFDQTVALKLIRETIDSAQLTARFENERQILAQLNHDNICKLIDGGLTEDEQPWFAMEFIAGRPLNEWLSETNPSNEKIVSVFIQIAEAVAYAHQNLVVHRDLKPANILITDKNIVKLLDFGIAKVFEPDHQKVEVTQTGIRPLTPAYASPEQLRGERMTPATDIYALGVILYEMFAGRRPHNLTQLSPAEREKTVSKVTPKPPSEAENLSAQSKRFLAGDLDLIILKSIHKDVKQRYISVESLIDDLNRFSAGRPILARPDSAAYRTRKYVQRNKILVGSTSVVAVLLILVTILAVNFALTTKKQSEAVLLAQKEAESTSVFLQNLFYAADPSVANSDTLSALDLLDQGVTRLDKDSTITDNVKVRILEALAHSFESLGKNKKAKDALQIALTLSDSLNGRPSLNGLSVFNKLLSVYQMSESLAKTDSLFQVGLTEFKFENQDSVSQVWINFLSEYGIFLESNGKHHQALIMHERALVLQKKIYPEMHRYTATSYSNIASVHRQLGDYDKALALAEKALAIRKNVLPENHTRIISTLATLGGIYESRGNYAKARAYYQEVLVKRKQVYTSDNNLLALALNNLGIIDRRLGLTDESVRLLTDCVAMNERLYGRQNPQTMRALNNLQLAYRDQGKTAEAKAILDEILVYRLQRYGKNNPTTGVTYYNIGALLHDDGQPENAEFYFRETLRIDEAAFGPDHPGVAIDVNKLAAVLSDLGRFDEAAPLFERALAIYDDKLPAGHPRIAESLLDFGVLKLRTNQPDSALANFEQSLNIRTEALEAGHWRIAESNIWIGAALMELGRFDEAKPFVEAGFETLEERKDRYGQNARRIMDIYRNKNN